MLNSILLHNFMTKVWFHFSVIWKLHLNWFWCWYRFTSLCPCIDIRSLLPLTFYSKLIFTISFKNKTLSIKKNNSDLVSPHFPFEMTSQPIRHNQPNSKCELISTIPIVSPTIYTHLILMWCEALFKDITHACLKQFSSRGQFA